LDYSFITNCFLFLMYRALFLDIDGTITDAQRKADLEAIRVLRKIAEQLLVVLTSGNVLPVAYGIRQFIGLSGPIIAENGGVVLIDGNLSILASIDEPKNFFNFASRHIKLERIFTDLWRLTEIALKPEADYEKLVELSRGFAVRIERTGFAIHIMPSSISKANAMKYICQNLGLSLEECIAIGDGDNDAQMLEIAGFSGAPANASQLAKQKAKYVANESYGRGFIEIIERAGFCTSLSP